MKRCLFWANCLAALLAAPLSLAIVPGVIREDAPEAVQAEITALIQQLGADDFSQREEAATKLAEIRSPQVRSSGLNRNRTATWDICFGCRYV